MIRAIWDHSKKSLEGSYGNGCPDPDMALPKVVRKQSVYLERDISRKRIDGLTDHRGGERLRERSVETPQTQVALSKL